jgi:hypothetical protein
VVEVAQGSFHLSRSTRSLADAEATGIRTHNTCYPGVDVYTTPTPRVILAKCRSVWGDFKSRQLMLPGWVIAEGTQVDWRPQAIIFCGAHQQAENAMRLSQLPVSPVHDQT